MQTMLIHNGDNLLDAATKCGNPSALFDLAIANGMQITDELIAGNEIKTITAEADTVKKQFSSFTKLVEKKLIVENLLDAATSFLNPEQLFEWAVLNGLEITDEFAPGTTLKVPEINKHDNAALLFSSYEKKKQVIVYYGQTVIDLCVQTLGDAEKAFEFAVMNNMQITDDLTPGQSVVVPSPSAEKRKIVDVFALNKLKPASAVDAAAVIKPEGIDFWAIEDDFEVQE